MIPAATIKEAMNLIAAYVGITFIRAEQNGARPALPFMEYKVTSQVEDPAYQDDVTLDDDDDDPTVCIVTSERGNQATVSLSFYGNEYSDIWSYAELARDYIESEAGKEAIAALGIFPRLKSPETNDRTSFLETEYEYRVGFDVAFEGSKTKVDEVPALDLAASITSMTQN